MVHGRQVDLLGDHYNAVHEMKDSEQEFKREWTKVGEISVARVVHERDWLDTEDGSV